MPTIAIPRSSCRRYPRSVVDEGETGASFLSRVLSSANLSVWLGDLEIGEDHIGLIVPFKPNIACGKGRIIYAPQHCPICREDKMAASHLHAQSVCHSRACANRGVHLLLHQHG